MVTSKLGHGGAWRAAGTLLLAAASCAQPSAPPNVVLVVVDTLRADRLGCYGYERDTSPHIDRLAAEGARYQRAISQAPWTTPSIGSLLTSRYPSEIGIEATTSALADELLLLPEALRAGGYTTAGVVSHSFCSSRFNFDQGFDSFDESNVKGHKAVTSADVTQRALELVDAFEAQPFFLWVHYFDTHFAYVHHEEFPFEGPEDYAGPVESGLQYKLLFRMREQLNASDLEELRSYYDSEIAWTDHWIGALFDGLRERGLWDDALVILTADHGEEFRDHGTLGHSRTLYDELVRVPLLIKSPRGAPYARVGAAPAEPVALLDVFPSVLDAAGIPAPPGLAGVSLFGTDTRARPIVSETARKGGVRSLVDDPFKLIHRLESDQVELYDLSVDPLETRDLADEDPERAARMRAALAEWAASLETTAAPEVELDAEEQRRLEELGYTE